MRWTLLCALLVVGMSGGVLGSGHMPKIVSVWPSRGSIAGGTRMHIKGSGFSTNMNDAGNQVIIGGKYPCAVIPLHSTVNQIACKTSAVTTGDISTDGRFRFSNGNTADLNVSVIVDGAKVATCASAPGSSCQFMYTTGWWHTPRLHQITPAAVKPGTVIAVDGRWLNNAFQFEHINAPSQEIPLTSVKIATRPGSGVAQAENEPFGQSGSRCLLFDPEIEEPFGIIQDSDNPWHRVHQFKCQVGAAVLGANRHNLSVAILGTSHNDRDMNMGESAYARESLTSDHEGVSFQISQMPVVESVWPSTSGMLGGDTLTIRGDSFNTDPSNLTVMVAGVPCAIISSTIEEIKCILGPQKDSAAPPPGEEQPGGRGFDMKIWYEAGGVDFEELKGGLGGKVANVSETGMDFMQAPFNIQSANSHSQGPAGLFRAFFRAPVTSNYSFIIASDDHAELWAGTNSTHSERVINFDSWCRDRDWTMNWEYDPFAYDMRRQTTQHADRSTKRPIFLEKGQFLHLTGMYFSGQGGDHFSLAVKQHESPVNRRHTPHAVDEKQLIQVVPSDPPSLEEHVISLVPTSAGQALSGTFTLEVGGQTSRALRVNATSHEVAAALRELLGNCEGDVGDALDAGGNSMDCVQGYGFQYRGFANTHSGGEVCADWKDWSDWHPQLALTAGLTGNYCRNPSKSSIGPHCYTPSGSRRSCDYDRCGGADPGKAAFVETFEELQDDGGENAGMQSSWREYEGVRPHPTADTAFCGRQSMYLPNSFSHQRSNARSDRDKKNNGYPTSLDEFPWMCMAYKIPSTSLTAMRFHYTACVERDRQGVCERRVGNWRTIDMTNPPGDYHDFSNAWRTVGSWGIIPDNQWHYTCINLKQMIQTNDEEGSGWSDYEVHNLDFYASGALRGTLASNEMWLDEFSFSATPRALTQKEHPALGGRVAQVAGVRAEAVAGGGHVYAIDITYQDCGAGSSPLQIKVNTAGVSGPLSPVSTSTVVREHTPIIEGKVAVSAGALSAEWAPYATAEEVKDALVPLLGETKVHRVGKCNAGIGWYVTMTHAKGDRPPLSATLKPVGSSAAAAGTVRVETVEDGGLIMGPVPGDYLHQVSDASHMHLTVNGGAAMCEGGKAACGFAYNALLTPKAASVSATPSQTENGTHHALTLSGERFSSDSSALPSVTVGAGGVPCKVDAGAYLDTSISCTVEACLGAGAHNVTVVVPGRGLAAGQLSFVAAVHVSSASPSTINGNSPAEVRLSGSGFSPLPDRNNITVGGQPCPVLNATCSVLFCLYTPATSARRRRLLSGGLDVQVSVNDQPAVSGGSLLVGTDNAPTVTSVTPTKGTAGGGMTVTVAGTNLGATGAAATIGGAACATASSSATQIVCKTSPWVVGAADVVVTSPDGVSSDSVQYTYVLDVSALSASAFGIGGGVGFTLTGEGFLPGGGSPITTMATATLLGREVYSVGYYTPPLIREAQDVSLRGTNTHEVLTIGVRANATTYEGDFTVAWFGGSTAAMPRGVNQYVLQQELNRLVPAGSDALVTSQPASHGWNWWRVEVRGLLGNVDAPTVSTSGSADGVSVSTDTQGEVTRGTFTLMAGANATTGADVAADASPSSLVAALTQIGFAATVAPITPPEAGALRTWRVTFTEYAGMYPLLSANASGLTAGGSVSVRRITPGSSEPSGTWKMHMSGASTVELPLNATESEVQAAAASLPGLHDVAAISIDSAPGPIGDRAYPRQWVVSFSREGVEGPTARRCTDPRYVDWSPDACPRAAGDLFLAFHSYYWPASLPRPSDLGSEERQERLLRACAEEAVTLGLTPVGAVGCEALVPLETLPECGKGSGTSPPCWEQRFSTASVRHRDGTSVSYTRDDSRTPSDFEKGYRFWVVTGLAERIAAQQLRANASLTLQGYAGEALGALTGVESHIVSSLASARLTFNATVANDASLNALTPGVAARARSFARIVADDAVYRPVAEWRFGGMLGGALPAGASRGGVSLVPGVLPQDEDGSAGMANASLLALPYHPSCNPSSELTVEIWVRPTEASHSSSLFSPLVRSVGSDAASGFALVVSEGGKWQFLVANGDGTSAPLASRGGMLVLSDAAWSACTATSDAAVGEWAHVAGTYGRGVQRIYVNGALEAEVALARMSPNLDGPVVFGGGCEAAGAQCGDSAHHCSAHAACAAKCASGCAVGMQGGVRVGGDFAGSLDEGLLYARALTPNTVLGHARANAEVVRGTVGVSLEGARSSCSSSACAVTFSSASTPSLASVVPSVGWEGSVITVTGQLFTSGSTTIKVGGVDCASPTVSPTQAVCTVGAVGRLGAAKVSVFVAGRGNAANTLPFEVVSQVSSVSPSEGSTLGGTALTLTGQGFAQGGSVKVHVGAHECAVASSSATEIKCDLPSFLPAASSGRALTVLVRVGGAPAQCTASGGCAVTPTDAATPSITAASPSSVTASSTLTLTGTSLPTGASGFPLVAIGGTSCSVTSSTGTSVACTVADGEGGIQPLTVRFAAGYASVAVAARSLTYQVAVTSVSPADGSEHGGRVLTVSGTGFSASPAHVIASVGGRPARVVSSTNTQIVLSTPQRWGLPSGGVERGVARSTGSTSNLQACVSALLGSADNTSHVADGQTVVAVPQGLVSGGEHKLADGDMNTAWRSQRTHGSQSFVFDLGASTTVHALTVQWEGHGAKAWPPVLVGLASGCSGEAAPQNFSAMSDSGVDGVALDTAASGRYVVLTLPLPTGGKGVGIRGISIQDTAVNGTSQGVSVVVGGVYGAACGSGCSHAYLAAPSLSGVRVGTNLSYAVAGVDSLHVTLAGLAAGSCSSASVDVGGTACPHVACSADNIECSLPATVVAGRHRVTVTVSGLGMASGHASLEVSSRVMSISPSAVGAGGGVDVTITGVGFPPSPSVQICGADCAVSSATATQVTCRQGPLGDRSVLPKRRTVDTTVASGADDAYEYAWGGGEGVGGGVVVSSETLGFHQIIRRQSQDWHGSEEKAYMRFSLDVPFNSTVTEARLHVKAESESCYEGSTLRLSIEDSDDAAPIDPQLQLGLSGRPKASAAVEWVVGSKWKWAEEDQESDDIAALLNSVVRRRGWRAGNHVLIEMYQMRTPNRGWDPCRVLSADAGLDLAPRLRVTFDAPHDPGPLGPCAVTVTSNHGAAHPACPVHSLFNGSASASSEDVPLPPSVARDTYPKEDVVGDDGLLKWYDAVDHCSQHNARLCKKEEIFDGSVLPQTEGGRPEPFFGPVAPRESNVWVPYWYPYGGRGMAEQEWLAVDEPRQGDRWYWPWWWNNNNDHLRKRTELVACCGDVGHPARLAADGNDHSFWRSKAGAGEERLDFDAGGVVLASRVSVKWARGEHAVAFRVEASVDGTAWVTIADESAGVGGDYEYLVSPEARGYRHLRLTMTERAPGKAAFGVRELQMSGCPSEARFALAAVSNCSAPSSMSPPAASGHPHPSTWESSNAHNDTCAPLVTASPDLSPEVSSVVPARGTTAGGTDVTITGRFFDAAAVGSVTVSFGGFPCEVTNATASLITCKTSASGVKNGGVKYVVVTVPGHGDSQPGGDAGGADTYWYVDAWSARTTWGGSAPPTGCGSYPEDQHCTESVVIPEGQVILLDVSPPRLFLLLIEGTLIFDRKDIHLQVHYVLLRGGHLEVGTELEPFQQRAEITVYGHPKSIELPTFGSKVIACYRCTMDMHGVEQVSWTQLATTAAVGHSSINLVNPVAWPIGSRIVIATTDYESFMSSHSEVATVTGISNGGKTVSLGDITVCSNTSLAGHPTHCESGRTGLKYPHLGEVKSFDGRPVAFRAEVGLLSRNIIVRGDPDRILCPEPKIADDGVTELSCNQFGVQFFFHSPGHESLRVRMSNVEVANGGQAFRLGRYAMHWHMIGNVRQSFQRNCSIHHSWNRGTAIHGTNHLRLIGNFIYTIMGHSFFIEDGTEEHNRVEDNLAVKSVPSMNLLNTDQTPAGFWIVTMRNYILRNHAVASRRYGIWLRPEVSVTGTSVNTPMDVHPINIPVLQIEGNEVHSNGKYGLRVFDIYKPNQPSVIRDTFTWRNGKAGFTATVIGQVGFDGVVAAQNGDVVFESRSTDVPSWDVAYIRNALMIDYTGLPLADSYAATEDSFAAFGLKGGPAKDGGLLMPWNEKAGGGFSLANITFVNFKYACLRGCAHCGRGGSPFFGDGAFETRTSGMRFVNSSQRALFRHPNEAFFYDMDGTLTGSGIVEDYTRGGTVKGSSMVGVSPLIPPAPTCAPTAHSTLGTGGAVCHGVTFRRSWYHARQPTTWIGKPLCVRAPWTSTMDRCHSLGPTCHCLPYLKKAWMGNVWLAADGYRYNLQMDLQAHELADPGKYSHTVWDARRGESFMFTQRLLQFRMADAYGRPNDWTRLGSSQDWALNWDFNATACSTVGCGQIQPNTLWPHLADDQRAVYTLGVGAAGKLAVPDAAGVDRAWTFQRDADGNGGQHTYMVKGNNQHNAFEVEIEKCPRAGCNPPPPPPPPPPPDTTVFDWTDPYPWLNTSDSTSNPHNRIEYTKQPDGTLKARTLTTQQWEAGIPSAYDNVWIPSWRRVRLNADTPVLGHVIVEGTLVINSTADVTLTATYLEIKGGTVIIAHTDENATVTGDFEGMCTIKLLGTNPKLSAIHGGPRETPQVTRGKQAVVQAPGMLGVFGTLIARGKRVAEPWALLDATAHAGNSSVTLDRLVDWPAGSEVVVSPTSYNMHEAETRRVVSAAASGGKTVLQLDAPLQHRHHADPHEVQYGTRSLRMQGEVSLLTRNIVITGSGEGEQGVGGVAYDYGEWNAQKPAVSASGFVCGNGVCEFGETSATCPADCRGPAEEFGASISVAGYDEDYVLCSGGFGDQVCNGYSRSYSATAHVSDVEVRYFGQNNIRPGLEVAAVGAGSVSFDRVSFNRGYYFAVSVERSRGVALRGNLFYRSHLPTLTVGSGASETVVEGNLAVVGIFWNTHRGAYQGKGINLPKRDAMPAMFYDAGAETRMVGNRAAGSERAGFGGTGVACGVRGLWEDNEAHSALAGFWFDHYRTRGACRELHGFTAWRMWEYGVYGEVTGVGRVSVSRFRSSDNKVGAMILMGGPSSLGHVRRELDTNVTDALIVGRSAGNGPACDGPASDKPGLHACKFFMAWCGHLNGVGSTGVIISSFMGGGNMAPKIKPWTDAGSYPAIYGRTDVAHTTFADFGAGCNGRSEAAIRGNAAAADARHPTHTSAIEMVRVAAGHEVNLYSPKAAWVNQADCIDMDCDGGRNTLVRDEDGTLLLGGGGDFSSVVSRGEKFNSNNFFGLEYGHPMNKPAGMSYWYPNLPALMRTDRQGSPVNVSNTWLRRGYGIPHTGCTLVRDGMNGWKCLDTSISHRMLVVENMDADHEIRRVSPVAFSSSDGYTHLANGCMDHGWCFSYTCLKRLMTFWTIIRTNTEYAVHFTGTEPQGLRLSLLHAPSTEAVVVKIYYTGSLRLQVFVGRRYIEDVNMKDGKRKAQLFKDGKWPANDGAGGYANQRISLDCACRVGGQCFAVAGDSPNCETPSNMHGASTFVKGTGMLHVMVRGHGIDDFVQIRGMPVVQISMGVSTSVADFYLIKDSFISNLAGLLGIAPSRVTIVDVVAGNARREGASRALQASGSTVEFEIEPDATVAVGAAEVSTLESDGLVSLTVTRTENILSWCSVQYTVTNSSSTTAVPGTHFAAASGTLTFAPTEEAKAVVVPLTNVSGYAAGDVTFVLSLSSAVNATLGTPTTLVSVRNVHPPAPTAPEQSGATPSAVWLTWAGGAWSNPPSGAAGTITGWEVQCKSGSSSSWDASTVHGASETNVTRSGLTAYSLVTCRVRAVANGHSAGDWSAEGAMRSQSVCGDSSRDGSEGCDDGNTADNDGCSAACVVEPGYSCDNAGAEDTCEGGCGAGTKGSREGCDDGNLVVGDGCDSACNVEQGYSCVGAVGELSVCGTVCGDGLRTGAEVCDDGNTAGSDGCSADCAAVESGWTCSEDAAGKSVCSNCGNGILEGSEVCDSASAACVSCSSVAAGYQCTGSVCVGGPAAPGAPAASGATTTSLSWAWAAADGRGLALSSHTFEYRNTSSAAWTSVSLGAGSSHALSGLTHSTGYVARVRACTSAGCGGWSPESIVFQTSVPPQSETLSSIGAAVSSQAESGGLGLNVTSPVTVEEVAKEPEAPAEGASEGALNQSQVEALLANVGEDGIDEDALTKVLAAEATGESIVVYLSLSAASYEVQNTGSVAAITVTLSRQSGAALVAADLAGTSTVEWTLTDGTAVRGTDYLALSSGTLTFLSGQLSQTLSVPVIDTGVYAGAPRTFTIALSAPSGGSPYTLQVNPAAAQATVSITDSRGTVTAQFAQAEVSGTSSIAVPVTRSDAWKELAARVIFETFDGTAKAGADYVAQAAGTAVFAAGQTAGEATVSTVLLGASGVSFGVRVVRVEVEAVAGSGVFGAAAAVGAQSECTVKIVAACGNGLRTGAEECDDGNELPLDGCSGECTVEAGYECTGGGASAADACALPATPPAGKETVKASARLTGVSAATFNSDVSVRLAFVRGLADALGISADTVAIEGASRRSAASAPRAASRRLLQDSVTVVFRVMVDAGAGADMAAKVSEAAESGDMAERLRAQGLDVEVALVSSPSVTDSSGVEKTLDEILAEGGGGVSDVVVAGAVGGVLGLFALCICGVAAVRLLRGASGKGEPDKQKAAGASKVAPDAEDGEGPGGGPQGVDVPAAGAATPGVVDAGAGVRSEAALAPTAVRMASNTGDDAEVFPTQWAQRRPGDDVMRNEIHNAMVRDWLPLCDSFFEGSAEAGRFLGPEGFSALVTGACVGVSNAHVTGAWESLVPDGKGEVDCTQMLDKAASSELDREMLHFWLCLPTVGKNCDVGVLRGSLTGVFSPDGVEQMLAGAGDQVAFSTFVEKARAYAQSGGNKWGGRDQSAGSPGKGPLNKVPSRMDPTNAANEKSAVLHFKAAATRLEIAGPPAEILSNKGGRS